MRGKSLQSCLALCNPRTAAHRAPLSMGFSRQEYWSGLPCPLPGDLPNPGVELSLFCLLHHSVGYLPPAPPVCNQFSSVAQPCLTLCDPMDYSISGFPVHSQSLLKFMFIDSVMPSNHLILRHPLLLPPSILSSIRVFPSESVLPIRWPKYWSFSFRKFYLTFTLQTFLNMKTFRSHSIFKQL